MELKFTDHPLLPSPTDEEIVLLGETDPQLLKDLYTAHEGRIRASIEDPLRQGFDLDGWHRMREGLKEFNEVVTLGGNRSGKTTGCAKLLMEDVTEQMDGHVVCFSQNADTSIKIQQAAVWEMMPDTRTRVDFKTYTQYSNNQTILEGFEFGFKNPTKINLGAWLDEYLGDAALVNTLRFRLATRNSKMVIGFTPIDGYTPFIAEYLKNAQTLETRPAELLRNAPVPVVQYSPDRDAGIVYLHSDENPFGGYDRIAKDLKGRPEDEIKVRAYGLPVKSANSLLPYFNTEVNVLSEEPNKYDMTFPDISDKSKFTCYQVVDPAGARNYTVSGLCSGIPSGSTVQHQRRLDSM
jgi:hypothetical protein